MTIPPDTRWCFFLGPDKAGSTWIQRALSVHPSVCSPAEKDLFYFDRYYGRGVEWYTRKFHPSNASEICVEVCHDYLFNPVVPQRIFEFSSTAILVCCLRDPVDRAVSAYLYMHRQGRTNEPFSSALRHIAELTDHARYGEHLSRYLEYFPLDQLRTLDFRDLSEDPQHFAQALFRSLGVDPLDLPLALLLPVRSAKAARWQPVASAGRRLAVALRESRLEALLAFFKSSDRLERVLFRELASDERPYVSDRDRAFLRAQLLEDALLLDSILGTAFVASWWGQ